MQKLQDAKSASESDENFGKRYSREALGFRAGLDSDTVTKVFAGEIGVDKQTLTCCFKAFNLQLNSFEFVIWRSLLPAPAIKDLVAELISFLSNGQDTNLEGRINYLKRTLVSRTVCIRKTHDLNVGLGWGCSHTT